MTTQEIAAVLPDGKPEYSRFEANVSVWVPDNPQQASESHYDRHCDRQRCALISIFTDSNYNFSVEPVINLMNGELFTDLIQ